MTSETSITLLPSTSPSYMVTLHEALKFVPSDEEAVIVATPALIALILPFWSTVKTAGLLEDQVTVLVEALDGVTVALKRLDEPLSKVMEDVLRLIPETSIAGTVTTHWSVV